MRVEKEEGVVLSAVKYGESGIVVNVLTRSEGRRGFMASAGRGRGRVSSMLLPLSVIEFVTTGRKPSQMRRMSDVHLCHPFKSIPFSPLRRAEAFFIAELLCHAVPDDVPDPDLFDFVSGAVAALDDGMDGDYNFHLFFMMRLADYLGFGPDINREGMPIFDMAAGTWVGAYPPHPDVVTGRMADLWHWASSVETSGLAGMPMSRVERQELITLMTKYYRLHQPGFRDLSSQQILAQL